MSRPLRIQYSGAVYHVMNRGNARCRIFGNSDHYQLFLKCLSETVKMWETKVHAFTLLPNHYHLLLETPLGNLSRAMRHLNHVYTQRYNKMVHRDGHLFRGRYKAILVEEDAYLVELARYIHLNPVKAGLVKNPEKHQWTSHRHYLTGDGPDFLTTERLLGYFARRKNLARRKFHEFVMDGVPERLQMILSSSRWPSVFSSENFEEWIKWNFVKDLDDELLEYKLAYKKDVSEKALQKILCQLMDVKWDEVIDPSGRKAQRNRAVAIWCYRRYLKMGYGDLSRQFGVVPSRITAIIKNEDIVTEEFESLVDTYLKSEK